MKLLTLGLKVKTKCEQKSKILAAEFTKQKEVLYL